MSTIISPFLTFPNISWWAKVVNADMVIFDKAEHFQKMTFRNRYRISGANNSVLLSVPLVNGRNQHTSMADVQIHNTGNWQKQHWRTLVSVYKRSPFFDHYEDSLRPLYETELTHLIDFNRVAIALLKQELKFKFEIQETDTYLKEYPPDVIDLRNVNDKSKPATFPKYYQVFEDRIGFIPDLSVLDLLFSEGPAAADLLIKMNNK